MNVARRLSVMREKLASQQTDALLVSDPVNVAYLTAFDGVFDGEDAHAVVITADSALLYTDSRYALAARAAAEDGPWDVVVPKEDLYLNVCRDIAGDGVKSLALESQVAYGRFRYVSERFDGNVEAVDGWVEECRQVKDAEEIERIASAAAITDRAFEHILGYVQVGRTESEIALELEMFMRREGSEGVAFTSIVASGANSASPHARVTAKKVEPGDFLKLDFGARVRGYCSDMTRTIVVGTATDRQREMYEAVLAANAAGIAALHEGVPGSGVDAVARAVLSDLGFGEFFTHGLGHGVGLEIHELPRVGPRATKSIPAGSVVTIEPGVYVAGFGGVRIEDLVAVGEDGITVLSSSPKNLIEL